MRPVFSVYLRLPLCLGFEFEYIYIYIYVLVAVVYAFTTPSALDIALGFPVLREGPTAGPAIWQILRSNGHGDPTGTTATHPDDPIPSQRDFTAVYGTCEGTMKNWSDTLMATESFHGILEQVCLGEHWQLRLQL